jgi:hypothetical protein
VSDKAFVTWLCRNVLRRKLDAGGLVHWMSDLAKVMTPEYVTAASAVRGASPTSIQARMAAMPVRGGCTRRGGVPHAYRLFPHCDIRNKGRAVKLPHGLATKLDGVIPLILPVDGTRYRLCH